MSAEVLREAAALMRSRATDAPVPAGPWETEFSDVIRTDIPFGSPGYLIVECATLAEARHIAGMDPVVALAVADWLEADATVIERHNLDASVSKAFLVATTYLGSAS